MEGKCGAERAYGFIQCPRFEQVSPWRLALEAATVALRRAQLNGHAA